MQQKFNNKAPDIITALRLIRALEQNSQDSCLPNIIKHVVEHHMKCLTNDESRIANKRLLYIQKLVSEFGDSEAVDSLTRTILDFTSYNRIALSKGSHEQMAVTKTPQIAHETPSTNTSSYIDRDTITTKASFFTSNRNYGGYRMNSSVSIKTDNRHVLSKSY